MTEAQGPLGVGRALSEARQAQGLSIADVAQQLKFMPRQIEALEAERFASLPGPTIARGMVRSYARLLKLEPEPLLGLMEGRVGPPEAAPQLGVRRGDPVPSADGGRRTTLVYLALSAAVLAIAAAAVYEWRHERPMQQFVAAGEAPTATDAPMQTTSVPEPAAPAREWQAPPPKPAAAAAPEPLPAVTAKPKPAAPSAPAKAAAPVAAPVAAPAEAARSAAAERQGAGETAPVSSVNRLAFKFEEEAWVEVIDAEGRRLISSLNAAGTERSVRARPPLNLVIGNAQHVSVTYNGRAIDLKPHIRVEVARFTIE